MSPKGKGSVESDTNKIGSGIEEERDAWNHKQGLKRGLMAIGAKKRGLMFGGVK